MFGQRRADRQSYECRAHGARYVALDDPEFTRPLERQHILAHRTAVRRRRSVNQAPPSGPSPTTNPGSQELVER